MSQEEGFKFSCPFCAQRIRAYPEHVGGVVNCPGCGEEIMVPNPDSGFHHVDHTREGMWGFSAEEWQMLQGEDYEAVERIIAYPRQLWWECGAAAELLGKRLAMLESSVANFREVYYHDGTPEEHITFVYRAEECLREYCDIMNFTYHVITMDLQEAVVSSTLTPVLRFTDRMGREINRARALHESLFIYSLPQEIPCPEIHQIMTTWAPAYLDFLHRTVEQLRERAEYQRDVDMQLRLNLSLFPPNMPQMFILLGELRAKCQAAAVPRAE